MFRRALSLALAAGLLTLSTVAGAAQPDAAAERGLGKLRSLGCVACHTLDGSPQVGPTFAGLLGSTRQVRTGGALRQVVADDAYVARALSDPDADLADGYPARAMPKFALDEAELDDVLAALRHLSTAGEPATRGSLGSLVAAAIAFVLAHLVMSSDPLRSRAVERLGLPAFQGVYSLIVAVLFGWMLWAWSRAPFVALWPSPPWTRWVPLVGLPLVFVLMAAGYSTKNPTTAGQEAALDRPDAVTGILRVTRHPVNLSNALWALVHLPPNGDLASACLFGSIAVLAVAGTLHIERRRRRSRGDAWEAFAKVTSVVPFAAILQGRNRLSLREIGIWRVALGLGLYALALAGHTWAIGASPLPF